MQLYNYVIMKIYYNFVISFHSYNGNFNNCANFSNDSIIRISSLLQKLLSPYLIIILNHCYKNFPSSFNSIVPISLLKYYSYRKAKTSNLFYLSKDPMEEKVLKKPVQSFNIENGTRLEVEARRFYVGSKELRSRETITQKTETLAR